MITLLVEPGEFTEASLEVHGDAYRHLFRARRSRVGETVRVVDGRGGARWASIAEVQARRARLALGDEAPGGDPEARAHLIVAPPRFPRASWLVEKATELGAASVRFLRTERTTRDLGEGNLERLRRVAVSALQQCHGARLPEISGVHSWEELPALALRSERRFFLDLEGALPARHLGAGAGVGREVCVAIGPEGGWARGEREKLVAGGWEPVCLGGRTLRVETAALAAASLILHADSYRESPGVPGAAS